MSNTLSFWWANLPQMLGGLLVSLELVVMSLLVGMPMGLLLAVGMGSRFAPVRWLIIGIVEVARGAPALVMLYVVYFGLPALHWTPTAMVCAVIALAFTTSGYTAEYIRGGLVSVGPGTREAGAALAMPRIDILRYVVVPQGMRVAIPSLMGLSIQIFQATSLAYSIAVGELTAQAYSISSSSFRALEIFGLAGIIYAIITIPATRVANGVERRLSLRE